MQQLQDTVKDNQLLIKEFEDKMSLIKDENKILNEAKEFMQSKLDHIYENNILIQKDGGKSTNTELEEQNKEQNTFV